MVDSGFVFEDDVLRRAVGTIDEQANSFLTAVVGFHAPQVEAAAKTGAPWTDRTTNARNALFATPEIDKGKTYRIILGHGVPYGIWLEVRWSGRYAIIEPTIQSQGKEVMKTVQQGFMDHLIGGV